MKRTVTYDKEQRALAKKLGLGLACIAVADKDGNEVIFSCPVTEAQQKMVRRALIRLHAARAALASMRERKERGA